MIPVGTQKGQQDRDAAVNISSERDMRSSAMPAHKLFITRPLSVLGAAIILGATPLQAQQFDPPDASYANGNQEEDPAVLRTLPIEPIYRAYLPASVDLSYRLPDPGNQGAASSCTAWATAYAARSYYTSAYEARDTHDVKNVPSPAFVYNLSWRHDGKGVCGGGSSFSNAVSVLKQGAPSLADYPYRDSDCSAPPRETIAHASDFRVQGMHRVDQNRIDDVKGAVARSNPVLISFHDDDAWHKHRGAGVFDRVAIDRETGWHAMTVVGYDDRKQAFRLMNSWGKGWGDGGYVWVGYDVFKARVREAEILTVTPTRPPPVPPVQPPAPPRPQPTIVDIKPVPPPPPAPAPPPPKPVVDIKPPPAPPVDPGPPSVVPPTPQHYTLAQLAALNCGKVSVRQDGKNNILDGYVGSESDLELVKAVAANVPDTSVGDVLLAPWPQCETLQTLERPLATTDRPAIEIGPTSRFHNGDPLNITIHSPGQISYLYVSYVQADGSVAHLVQPSGLVAQPTLPHQTLSFGGSQNGGATFTIGPPFGREMIIAVASRSPLFDHALPAQQTEREYLTELRRALIYKPSPDLPDRELSASIATLQTEGK
jgi:Papain family cysteine protease/Domain of unknown function (DUF4384)